MDAESFRRHGHQFIDWLADYFEQVGQYPVRSAVKPGEVISGLPGSPPRSAEPMDAIFRDFEEKIMPGMSHWQHPGWFAYFPANNSPASVLAELLTAGLGAQCMIWQTSPAAAELEERMMQWLGQMLGLPPDFQGVIQDTASTATLCALLTAREVATGYAANDEGIREKLAVYVSAETHSSIEKGVKIAGFGRNNIRVVPTGADYAMLPDALQQAMEKDVSDGYTPACVVATLGTTSSMAMDPVGQLAGICRKFNAWLHVDAAFAGTAAIVPELRGFMEGVEKADSFVFNPHKWMLTNFDCSAYFVRDAGLLKKTFEIQPEYLRTAADNEVKNYRDWGIQLGRRFRALKLWFVIRTYGVEGLQAMVRKHVALAGEFAGWLKDDGRFELMAPVNLSLVCFRFNPGGMAEESLDAMNREMLEKVNESGKVFMTHTSLGGKYTLRLSVGQRNTERAHLETAWELISSFVHSVQGPA